MSNPKTFGTSNLDGATRADERFGYLFEDLRRMIEAAFPKEKHPTPSVAYPVPVFSESGDTLEVSPFSLWRVDNNIITTFTDPNGRTHTTEDAGGGTDEDNEDGGSCVTFWRIPRDCFVLVLICRYVKKNGRYGRRFRFTFDDISDEERTAGFCERTLRGLRPKRVLDIVEARSVNIFGLRSVNPPDLSNLEAVDPSLYPPQPDSAGANTTRATSLAQWPNPAGSIPLGYGPYDVYPVYENPNLTGEAKPTGAATEEPSQPENPAPAIARIDLTEYAKLNIQITEIGAIEQELDGNYYPITVIYTANLVESIRFRYARVGRREFEGGPLDYTLYGRTRTQEFELTQEQREDGTAVLYIGPFGPNQSRQMYHILNTRGFDYRDDTRNNNYVERYPDPESEIAGPDDIEPGFKTGHTTDLQDTYHTSAQYSYNDGAGVSPVPGAHTDPNDVDTSDIPAGSVSDFQNAGYVDTSINNGMRRILAVLQPSDTDETEDGSGDSGQIKGLNYVRGGTFTAPRSDVVGGTAVDSPAKRWEDWTSSLGSGTLITTSTTNISWQDDTHCLRFESGANKIAATRIKKNLSPGDLMGYRQLMRRTSSNHEATFEISIYEKDGASTPTLLFSGTDIVQDVTTEYIGARSLIEIGNYTRKVARKFWLVIEKVTTDVAEIDNVYLGRDSDRNLTYDNSAEEFDWGGGGTIDTDPNPPTDTTDITYTDTSAGEYDWA